MAEDDESVNPISSVAENDLFVFAPSVATVVILLAMVYGLGQTTVRLVDAFVTPLSPTMSTAGTLLCTVVYVAIAVGMVYRDNDVELPTTSF